MLKVNNNDIAVESYAVVPNIIKNLTNQITHFLNKFKKWRFPSFSETYAHLVILLSRCFLS